MILEGFALVQQHQGSDAIECRTQKRRGVDPADVVGPDFGLRSLSYTSRRGQPELGFCPPCEVDVN
jgi:hypothetical protein